MWINSGSGVWREKCLEENIYKSEAEKLGKCNILQCLWKDIIMKCYENKKKKSFQGSIGHDMEKIFGVVCSKSSFKFHGINAN